jgi:Mor family transcriptional regulator
MTSSDMYTLELEFPIEVADRLKRSHKHGIEAATTQAIKFWLQLGDDTWSTITKQADTEGLSRAEFVRKAVSNLMHPVAPAYVNMKSDIPLAERRKARDEDIAYRALRGAPRKELAKQYNISEIRVHQIVAKAKKELNRQKLVKDWTPDPYENA